MKTMLALALAGAASGAWAAALMDRYPPAIAEQLAALQEAERGAASKLPGNEARFLFSRKRWTPGSTILVAFNGGPPALHKAIAEQASLWSKYANIKLDFGFNPATGTYRRWSTSDTERVAHIRIGFSDIGYWSLIGTDSVASFALPNTASMNFEKFADQWPLLNGRWKTVVQHEFGHALGLHHEHQHPRCAEEFRWQPGPNGEPDVYKVFKDWLNWDAAGVNVNLRAVSGTEADISKVPDRKSLMFYAMPAQAYMKGAASPCFIPAENPSISKMDGLAMQLAYPKNPTQAIETALAYAQAATVLSQKQELPQLAEAEKAAVVSRIESGLEARKPLLYIHIQRESDRPRAAALQTSTRQAGFLVPGIENVSKKGLKSGAQPEVRFFRPVDASYAEAVAGKMKASGEENVRIVQVKSLALTVTRNLVEIWLP